MRRRSARTNPDVWARVSDAETPSPVEMATADAELDAAFAEPLSAAQLERIVARAIGSSAIATAPAAAARRGLALRTAGAAAALLLCLVSLGWVGARVVWPHATPSAYTLTVGTAFADATGAATDANARIAAFTFLDERCAYAIDALQQLATDENAAIARSALVACARLAATLAGSGYPAASIGEIDVLVEAPLALDRDAAPQRRAAAAAQLEALAQAALVAIGRAPCPSDREREHRTTLVDRFAEQLAQPLPLPQR